MRVLFIAGLHPESAWLFKALHESAHSLQRVDDLRDGIFLASQEIFDAVVVTSSETPPYADLLDALPKLAHAARGAPLVVTLGSAAQAHDRSRLLRAGADACFCQPISFIEMHERMHALCRAIPDPGVETIAGATLGLDFATRELVCGELRLELTRREYMLIECLLRHPNMPVARNQLIRYAWPENDDVDPASVNLVVARLRRKLAEYGSYVRIDTVNRYGYQISVARS